MEALSFRSAGGGLGIIPDSWDDTSMSQFRTEKDSMGEMQVPAEAMYGAQTARAVENFPVSGIRFSRDFIWALGLLKKHAARVNGMLAAIPREFATAIAESAGEVQEGMWDREFVLDIFQTGSGTSTNMNANEVIAFRASQIAGARVHPNDHVNHGQSSNDVIPTAIHLAALHGIHSRLIPALDTLLAELQAKTREECIEWVKSGKHL